MKIQFRQLFERSPDAMLIVDRAGQITGANAQAESLFGYARDQLRGESVQTVFPCQSLIPYQGTSGREDLVGHLIRAQEEERCRTAADVHDETVQMISAANLRLHQLRRRLQDPGQLQILDKLGETLSLSLSRLRQLIFDLRPVSLEHGRPATALREILEEMRTGTGIAYPLQDSR